MKLALTTKTRLVLVLILLCSLHGPLGTKGELEDGEKDEKQPAVERGEKEVVEDQGEERAKEAQPPAQIQYPENVAYAGDRNIGEAGKGEETKKDKIKVIVGSELCFSLNYILRMA